MTSPLTLRVLYFAQVAERTGHLGEVQDAQVAERTGQRQENW